MAGMRKGCLREREMGKSIAGTLYFLRVVEQDTEKKQKFAHRERERERYTESASG